MVPVFDAGFVLGDGVWTGMRLVKDTLPTEEEHMARLYEGANAIRLDIGMDRDAQVGERKSGPAIPPISVNNA